AATLEATAGHRGEALQRVRAPPPPCSHHCEVWHSGPLSTRKPLQIKRFCSPNGIRTRVATLRGWCPRPLDDGARGGRRSRRGRLGRERLPDDPPAPRAA